MFGERTCVCKSPSLDVSKLTFPWYPIALIQHFLPMQIEHLDPDEDECWVRARAELGGVWDT